MGPRALPASVVLRGSISAQQTAASCRRQRARAVTATTESRQKHARTSVLVALPLPNHRESAAADLATPYTGLGIPVLPIEAARTYAPGISTGAVAVFRAFSTPSPAPRSGFRPRAVRWEFGSSLTMQSSDMFCSDTAVHAKYMYQKFHVAYVAATSDSVVRRVGSQAHGR